MTEDNKQSEVDIEPAATAPEDDDDTESSPEETSPDETEELKKKLATSHDRLLRTAAELDNLRKRARRDAEDARGRGRSEVLLEILPVIDSVDLALSSAESASEKAAIVEGVKMIKKQFETAAQRFDIQPVDSDGLAFDPNFHEAVAQVFSDEHPSGQIVSTMRKGYTIGDKLLRPAMVIVSKGVQEPEIREAAGSDEDITSDEALPDQLREAIDAAADAVDAAEEAAKANQGADDTEASEPADAADSSEDDGSAAIDDSNDNGNVALTHSDDEKNQEPSVADNDTEDNEAADADK